MFDQPINSKFKTYENIRRIATGQRDDCTTGCLLDYSYFKENYKMIAIDLSKQQALDADPRAIQQINFKANLDREYQLNKLKSAIKNKSEVVLRLSSNMIGDNETNFPHKLLLMLDKSQIFVKLLLINHQLISNYQKRDYLR